jgi:nucleoside triphosphate pyrophosphatase
MTSMPRLVLASGSPRRLELLGRLGLEPEVLPADLHEAPHPGEAPRAYVARLAEAKAEWARARRPDAWILGADTEVVLGDEILGKPSDEADAARMLAALAGRRHLVLTATCLLRPGAEPLKRLVATEVAMRALAASEVARYVAGGEWRGKAGGYAAQGAAAAFIREIHGSFTNVVGLPLAELALDLAPLLLP